jgi:hypothetical protein
LETVAPSFQYGNSVAKLLRLLSEIEAAGLTGPNYVAKAAFIVAVRRFFPQGATRETVSEVVDGEMAAITATLMAIADVLGSGTTRLATSLPAHRPAGGRIAAGMGRKRRMRWRAGSWRPPTRHGASSATSDRRSAMSPVTGPYPAGMIAQPRTPALSAFLIAVPLAWAVLLLFHPNPDPGDMYGSLRDESGRWLVVHVGTVVFIGLMGAALASLVRGLPGWLPWVTRIGAGAFALFYGAAEAMQGIAVGVQIRHANAAPEAERAGYAAAIQSIWDDPITDDLATTVGAVGWLVAVLAAAVGIRRAGAPVAASILLALSGIVILHGPPIGPIGLVCFAAAVVLLARTRPG